MAKQGHRRDDAVCHGCGCKYAGVTMRVGVMTPSQARGDNSAAVANPGCRREDAVCHGCGCNDAGVPMRVVRFTGALDEVSW